MKPTHAFLAHAPIAALAAVIALLPQIAHAYVGPGAGLTAIGTVLALLAALALAMVGFVWYPLKRLLRRSPSADAPANEDGRRAE